uniref:Uncharacterized protein n=1 Tax=Amphimedon queenslandica TaxID=400682 RepID=A0A1X7T8N1_AMPQE
LLYKQLLTMISCSIICTIGTVYDSLFYIILVMYNCN